MPELPTGTVTFLFTDIEGSTALWERQPAAMRVAVADHDARLRVAITAHRGHVFRTVGDGLCAAFTTAPDAVAAALAAQQALATEPWGEIGPLRARLALHTGAVEVQGGDYAGACLNRLGRLLAAGHGGQVLLSQTTADLARDALPVGTSLRDMGEQRLRDLTRPEPVYQLLHPDLAADFPALRSFDAYPHNLPLQLTSFVGREQEVATVTALLGQTRLLTVTGAGGCGKTRLALQVAADLVDAYPGGVWFVDLAPLTDPDLVGRAVAGVLGIVEQSGQAIEATLVTALRQRTLVLMLDNCEHLLDGCAGLAEAVLRGCPGVRVLATSRELLGAAGEVAWRVPSLATPDTRAGLPPDRLVDYEAVRLFVERARQVQPAFAVTTENAVAVAQLCRRLDGIPLALELAAARLTALSAEQVAARLDDRFRLLTGGRRTALRRQQTLQAAIDWSHDLLTAPERALFRRLAVFAGGWMLDAAEAVCSGDGIEAGAVLDLLTRLVEKSLVVMEEPGRVTRYRLLETVRQYASDKLLAADEAAVVRDRHRDSFLALAEQAMPLLWTRDQLVWFDRLEAEHDNLRAALAWSHDQPDGGTAELRLAGALGQFWSWRGHNVEGLARLTAALAHADASAPPAARALALAWAGATAGRLANEQRDQAQARAWLEESRALALAAGDWRLQAQASRDLALGATAAGDLAERRALLEEAVPLARRAGEPRELTLALGFLAADRWLAGDEAAARLLLDEGLALVQASGERASWSMIYSLLATQAIDGGDYAGAHAIVEDALATARASGYLPSVVRFLARLGLIARLRTDYPAARAAYHEAVRLGDRISERGLVMRTIGELAGLHAALGRPRQAVRLFGATAGQHATRTTDMLLQDRGYVARLERDLAAARTVLGEAAFAAAWVEGEALTLEEAVAEALADAPTD